MTTETFFEKFELFADAPDAVGRMRELILSLALQGRLLSKSSSTGWKRVPLENIATIAMGNSPPGDTYNERGEGVPLINGPVEFSPGPFGFTVRTKFTTAPTKFCKKGDLLICVRGSTTGRTNIAVFDACIGRGVAAVSAKEHQPFVNLFLWQRRTAIFALGSGSTFPSISYDDLASLVIDLPPLAEQKRIVAKVDELMALCDRLEAQQQERDTRHATLARASLARFAGNPTPANLQFLFHRAYHITPADLRKSILTLAVQGKLVPRTSSPPLVPLQAILAEASVNGVSKGPTSDKSATEILRISAGTSRGDFYVNEDDFKFVDLPPNEITKYQLMPGDLLACRFNGNLHYVGRFSLYRGECGRVQVNPDKLIRFRVDSEHNSARYVCYAMNAAPTRQAIEAMCATTAGNIGLSAGRLKTVEIPLPPLAEQRRIVAKVDELMALVDQLEAQLTTSRAAAAKFMEAVVAELTAQSQPSMGEPCHSTK